jgi:DNA/RNA non-specific endonuclease
MQVDLADGTRFIVGNGAIRGELQARDQHGDWQTIDYNAVLVNTPTGRVAMSEAELQRYRGPLINVPSVPDPNGGVHVIPPLTEDERNRLNGTTISPIPPNTLPPLGGFQIGPPQTIEDLIIESRRTPNGSTRLNGYDYEFDGSSRIDHVEGDLNREDSIRNRAHQSGAGGIDRLPDDDGGHIVGNRFGPPGEEFNYIAQNRNVNRGEYRQLENDWAQLLAGGHTVRVEWDFKYTGDSQRPDGFTVRYRVDGGEPIVRPFRNSPGGK